MGHRDTLRPQAGLENQTKRQIDESLRERSAVDPQQSAPTSSRVANPSTPLAAGLEGLTQEEILKFLNFGNTFGIGEEKWLGESVQDLIRFGPQRGNAVSRRVIDRLRHAFIGSALGFPSLEGVGAAAYRVYQPRKEDARYVLSQYRLYVVLQKEGAAEETRWFGLDPTTGSLAITPTWDDKYLFIPLNFSGSTGPILAKQLAERKGLPEEADRLGRTLLALSSFADALGAELGQIQIVGSETDVVERLQTALLQVFDPSVEGERVGFLREIVVLSESQRTALESLLARVIEAGPSALENVHQVTEYLLLAVANEVRRRTLLGKEFKVSAAFPYQAPALEKFDARALGIGRPLTQKEFSAMSTTSGEDVATVNNAVVGYLFRVEGPDLLERLKAQQPSSGFIRVRVDPNVRESHRLDILNALWAGSSFGAGGFRAKESVTVVVSESDSAMLNFFEQQGFTVGQTLWLGAVAGRVLVRQPAAGLEADATRRGFLAGSLAAAVGAVLKRVDGLLWQNGSGALEILPDQHILSVNTELGKKKTYLLDFKAFNLSQFDAGALPSVTQLFVLEGMTPDQIPAPWRGIKPTVLPADPREAREVLSKMKINPGAVALLPSWVIENPENWDQLLRENGLPGLAMTDQVIGRINRLHQEGQLPIFLAAIQQAGGLILRVEIQERANEHWLYLWA